MREGPHPLINTENYIPYEAVSSSNQTSKNLTQLTCCDMEKSGQLYLHHDYENRRISIYL